MTERVWDQFLTESDKAHLAVALPKVPYGFGERAAVLSVDNYRSAIGDRPEPLLESVKTWPSSTGLAGWKALESVERLIAAARAVGLPVIHVTGLAAEESGVAGWSARRGPRGTVSEDAAARTRNRRRYDIVDQAAPMPGEVVLKKTAPSAFFGTPLLAHLVSAGIDTLIVCGEAVSGCVRATVVDGCSNRLRMIIVEDCVYDRHEATRAMNLFDMDQKYGDVMSLADVLAWMERGSYAEGADSADGPKSHDHSEETLDEPAEQDLLDAVVSALPADAVPVSISYHPIHGHVLDRGGSAAIDAAAEAMGESFADTPHVVVPIRSEDVQHQASLHETLKRTEGGVLLVGVGYAPPSHEDGSTIAGDSCPECGATCAHLDSAPEAATDVQIHVCDSCGAAWDL